MVLLKQRAILARSFVQPGSTDGKPWVRFDFHTDRGDKFVTFEQDLADRLIEVIGYPVVLETAGDMIRELEVPDFVADLVA